MGKSWGMLVYSRQPLGRAIVVATSIGLIALGLAACGSSSSSSSSSSRASAASAKVPYVLGVAAATSGPIATSVGSIGPTVQAWGKWTNAHGGVDGHPVKVVSINDAGDPAMGIAAVKKMVQQDHIIAMVPGDGLESTEAAYLKSANIPVIGGTDAANTYLTESNWFSLGSGPLSNQYTALLADKTFLGVKKISVMYCSEVPACAQVADQIKGIQGKVGVKVVNTEAISSTATDYTAQCLAAKSAGAAAILASAGAQQEADIATSCARQDFNVPQEATDLDFSDTWLATPAFNGSIASVPTFPWIDNSIPATKAFQAAITQYLPQAKAAPAWGPSYASAWTSGELFAAAAKAGAMGNSPSPAGIFRGLYALKNETLGGLSAPINYVHGSDPNVKNKCAFVVEMKKSKFIEPQGLKTICMP
jgi:branched-chain amino acid transport system substrate-binding protein